MAITFPSTSNFGTKLMSDLLRKTNIYLDFGTRVPPSEIINYLIIQLTNSIMQAAYL